MILLIITSILALLFILRAIANAAADKVMAKRERKELEHRALLDGLLTFKK